MKVVGLRELKNLLSEYVRQVRRGEEVLVTDRGAVVAELGPPGRAAMGELQQPDQGDILRFVALSRIRRGRGIGSSNNRRMSAVFPWGRGS